MGSFKYELPEGATKIIEGLVEKQTRFKRSYIAKEKYEYIVHTVCRHQYNTYVSHQIGEKKERPKGYDGCRLNMVKLASIIGTNKKQATGIVKDLLEAKLIERTGNYTPTMKSFGYDLCEIPEKIELVDPPKRSKIKRKILKYFNEYKKDEKLKLYHSFVEKLSIDKEHPEIIRMFEGKYGRVAVINSNLRSILDIKEKRWRMIRHDNSRVHTNITNLNRVLRPFLRYENRSMVELDIRNSQPLLSYLVIKDYLKTFYGGSITELAELQEYKSNCEKGTFYDSMMDEADVLQEDRKEFKINFFKEVFFSKVNKARNKRIRNTFEKKYPICAGMIQGIKGGIYSEDYNQFAIQLQKIEAKIIFDEINIPLLKMGIPAFNIFDSIMVLPEHMEVAKKLIEDTFLKYNLKPTINYTDYAEHG